jgi:hypothetical protein
MKLSEIANVMQQLAIFEEAILLRKRNIVEATGNCVFDAINALQRIANENNFTIAIVGGAATIYHGYTRATKDVDIVLNVGDFQQILKIVHDYGFIVRSYNSSWMFDMIYEHPHGQIYELANGKEIRGVLVEVMREGMNKMPSPQEMGVASGLGFANLNSFIAMKLEAFRAQDIADIVAVLIAQQSKIIETEKYIRTNYPYLIENLEFCLKQMTKESDNLRSTQRYIDQE